MQLTNTIGNPVLAALLQHNFFPQEKRDREDFPPVFTTVSFTEKAARSLINSSETEFSKRTQGYDALEYKLTRFNGAVRILSIPHPTAYANLALSIADNWNEFLYTMQNKNSKIVPDFHPDGRIIIMDYENKMARTKEVVELSFGRRYVVRTDISNCFPSIYSHSIPWALVGLEKAKRDRSRRHWFNKIDKAVQSTKRNESHGLAIGPGTSHILAEAILARVDEEMSKDFIYVRYIDDYTAYCESEEDAERFVLKLTEELAKYKLTLNTAKTEIERLPQMSNSGWVIALQNMRPQLGNISVVQAVNYLDFAVELAGREPDGSVLKYALKTLSGTILDAQVINTDVLRIVVKYALALSFHHAVLIPLLDRLFAKAYVLESGFAYNEELQRLIRHHTRLRHSDAISWLLYFTNRYGVPIEKGSSAAIVASGDCVPMLLLYLSNSPEHQRKVIGFARKLARSPIDIYRLDQYWLLLYQLFHDNRIRDPYNKISELKGTINCFKSLKQEGVTFVTPPPPLPPILVV